jgi:hypothetical protein
VRGSHDGEEDLNGEQLVVAGEDQRVAEVGHALDEAQEERVRNAGAE